MAVTRHKQPGVPPGQTADKRFPASVAHSALLPLCHQAFRGSAKKWKAQYNTHHSHRDKA
jgi:hypothetical protein